MINSDYQATLQKMATTIKEADYVIVGGAAGMSAAAGPDWYNPGDPTYLEKFKAIEDKYHAGSIWRNGYLEQYTGKNWENRGDLWGFKLSLIHFVLHEPVYQPYQDLKAILKDKDYDLITTNQDVQFSKAFPDKDVATIQGDWSYFQCADKCHDQVYPNQTVVDQLFPQIKNGHLPENLIPRCPKCGAEMLEWVRGYEFLEGQHYNNQYAKYRQFIQKAEGKKTVYLELGVGMMTPMFIKEPFMNLTYQNPQATYITVNPKDAIVPRELTDRGIAVKYDLVKVLADLKECGISRVSAED
ncbi:NAD-dependent protein deacetylase [Latilactobacillus curvatus]|uniref:NAD-dependent protein deacetylase n=1 Tax=Latilactobacillus curvatus TaxID=28038 RepID=UPI000FECD19C|nr:NAD-dependent protein deacetylase [Latilactobacillus curvatus]QAR34979.1 NAD-dependent protein deacetylase [Latilactobacillus curvatus]